MPVICDKMICYGYVSDNQWYIVNRINDKRILQGEAKSNELAKRQLKKGLISLGAYFVDEVRSSKNNPIRMLTEEVIDDIIKEKGEL
jgi:hypothetical protein